MTLEATLLGGPPYWRAMRLGVVAACLAALVPPLSAVAATLRLVSPFTDHAVLQREAPVVVRGRAEPGAEVEVAFAGQRKSVAADGDGKWRLSLDPMEASKEPRVLVASVGDEKVADVTAACEASAFEGDGLILKKGKKNFHKFTKA